MTLTLHIPESRDLKPRLTVFGVGGAGGNAVNNMIARNLDGVEFVVANTDAQSLAISTAPTKIQLGEELTEGLGAGAKPEVGARAAEESLEKITDHLMGSHMCFITAGMGGGTGTGAAPVIAQAARQMGILTVGVVTKPFQFEGARRMKQAEAGIEELQQYVDTLIIIPNQNLFRVANENTTFTEAFGMADDVLYQGVKGVTDLMVRPGLVNLDFADIRSVMDEMGKAMMGTGEAEGGERAILAAERAIANPLLDEISLHGAKGVLINITGGDDLTLHEVDEASNKISSEVDANANIIFGSTYDPSMTGRIRVAVVATGIDAESRPAIKPRTTTRKDEAPAEAPADLFSKIPDTSGNAPRGMMQNTYAEEAAPMREVAPAPRAYAEPALPQAHTPAPREEVRAHAPAPREEVLAHAPAPQVDRHDDYAPPQVSRGEIEARAAAVRERVQAAVREEPVVAPPAPPATSKGSRFGIDTMIKRMSGHEDVHEEPPVAKRPDHKIESLPPRRPVAEAPVARPRMEEAERQRVDIPAFLRRKAN